MEESKILLVKRFAKMTDEELLNIVELEFSDYTEDALKIAKTVIENRGGIEKLKKNVEERKRVDEQKEIEAMIKQEEELNQIEEAEEKRILETHLKDIESRYADSDNQNEVYNESDTMNKLTKFSIFTLTISIIGFVWGYTYLQSHRLEGVASAFGKSAPVYEFAMLAQSLGILVFLLGIGLLIGGLVQKNRGGN